MSNPSDNVGKICTSLEKFWDVNKNKMGVKSRPVLIIGHELTYTSPFQVDYELLPISRIGNFTPDPTFDVMLSGHIQSTLSLNDICFVRSNKITWANVKNMNMKELGNMKLSFPELFNRILDLNRLWIEQRTFIHKANLIS